MKTKLKQLPFVVFFTILISSTSFGRVGDLEATSESRYGKPMVSFGIILYAAILFIFGLGMLGIASTASQI